MKIIAHRGNINGPNPILENNPEYILKTIDLGFDCEVDVSYIKNKLYLGHDIPQYIIDIDFLLTNKDKFWIHCKNIEALDFLHSYPELNIFWHNNDDYTITSKNNIWSYIGVKTTKNIICVMPELSINNLEDFFNKNNNNNNNNNYYGICTDYCNFVMSKLQS